MLEGPSGRKHQPKREEKYNVEKALRETMRKSVPPENMKHAIYQTAVQIWKKFLCMSPDTLTEITYSVPHASYYARRDTSGAS